MQPPSNASTAPPRRTRRWIGSGLLLGIALALPFLIHRCADPYDAPIRIAGGAAGSRFYELAEALAREFAIRHKLERSAIVATQTNGAIDNVERLRRGEVSFALYQPALEPRARPRQEAQGEQGLRFVANLYSQAVLLLVRKGVTLAQLRQPGRVVEIGPPKSADRELGARLAEHLGIPESNLRSESVQAVANRKGAGVDAVLLSTGLSSGTLPGLLDNADFALHDIPHPATLVQDYLVLSETKLAPGTFYAGPRPVPARTIRTVTVQAQLITRADVHPTIVENVTSILVDQRFLRRNSLGELYSQEPGHKFARRKAPFEPHPGAMNVYEPALKPPLSADFVEATEGLRSFIVSILITLFVIARWLHGRRQRRRGGRIDAFMAELLAIERAQLHLDQTGGDGDLEALQTCLDDVTDLRQRALVSFNSYEMTSEPGVDLFLEMAHAVSDKVNAKISRQRLDRAIRNLG